MPEATVLDTRVFEAAWRGLLPPGVSFSVGVEPPSVTLPAPGRAAVGAGVSRRMREFATGRWHARQALAALGLNAADLPRQTDGAPAWPPGVVGSISHTFVGDQTFAVAAVADVAEFAALGVDVEAPGRIEPRLWPGLFLPVEIEALLRLPVPQRGLEASLLWSAKEAAVKAGANRAGLDRMAISHDPQHADFTATSVCGSVHCDGKVVSTGGWIFAVASLRQGQGVARAAPCGPSFRCAASPEAAPTASCVTPVLAGRAAGEVMSQSCRLRSIY